MGMPYNNLAQAIPLLFLLAFGAFSSACEITFQEETELFERAEESYARGDYDGAVTFYRRFLELHPTSPLASIADQRLLTIERELDALMGRRGAPAPVYVSPHGSPSAVDETTGQLPQIHAPELPVLGR